MNGEPRSSRLTLGHFIRGRLPECREGWRYIIEDVCKEIGDALRPEEGDIINLVKIIENGGLLNIFWEGTLSARARVEVEQATERANVRSADECEICGFRNARLYSSNGWLQTACTGHGRGKPNRRREGLGLYA
jgi:hypothetical protein